MQEKHARELAAAADAYRLAVQALDFARERLVAAMQAAADGGARQSEIIRGSQHVWTREYVRRVIVPGRRDGPPQQSPEAVSENEGNRHPERDVEEEPP